MLEQLKLVKDVDGLPRTTGSPQYFFTLAAAESKIRRFGWVELYFELHLAPIPLSADKKTIVAPNCCCATWNALGVGLR
jgi:hypothetical protein